jgi:hypothetical protein
LDLLFLFVLLLCLLLILGLVVWPDVACQNFLNAFITDHLGAANYYYRLYTNNVSPGTANVLGDFTEAAFTGYAAIQGNTITWPAATLAGHIAQSTGSNLTFSNTSGAGVTVYGVYVTDGPVPTKLYFAERDPAAPVTIAAAGNYVYTPNQQFKSIN